MGCAGSKADADGEGKKAKPKASGPDRMVSVKNWVLKPSTDIRNHYELGKVLGKGQFGITRLAIDKRTGEKLACKTISKRKLVNPDDIEDVRREVQIMYHLAGHKHVVQLRGTYEDKSDVHLVMEVCSGGELFDRIVERGHYTEKDAARLVRTIVAVVAHCHNMGVIHRDLKPENFLLQDSSKDAVVKATDFGLSVFFKEGQTFTDIVGSAYYVAPEVLRRKYGKEADIWSCGVILYILLCGVPPFFGDSEQQIFEAVLRAPLDFAADPWPKISAGAKDCVRKMLVRDPAKRATAKEILNHEWLREGGDAPDVEIVPEVLLRIKGFAAMNKLKKEALKVIAFNLPIEEIMGLKSLFESIDNDKSGSITIEEMREGLRQKGSAIPDGELDRIMADADVNGDGSIDYQEFLAATIHLGKLEQEENLFKAFQYFDKDNSGTITREELLSALAGYPDAMNHVDAVLKEVDTDGNGEIDYEEFCKMMRSNDSNPKIRNSTMRNSMFLPK